MGNSAKIVLFITAVLCIGVYALALKHAQNQARQVAMDKVNRLDMERLQDAGLALALNPLAVDSLGLVKEFQQTNQSVLDGVVGYTATRIGTDSANISLTVTTRNGITGCVKAFATRTPIAHMHTDSLGVVTCDTLYVPKGFRHVHRGRWHFAGVFTLPVNETQ